MGCTFKRVQKIGKRVVEKLIMYKHFFKRFIDFALSLIGFIIISPVFIIVWIWLTIANKGAGALFFQERPGKEDSTLY